MKIKNYLLKLKVTRKRIALFASVFVTTSLLGADITTGLIAHYDFGNVAGTEVSDVSGVTGAGTLVGAPVIGVGQTGNGVQFSTATDYMTLPAGFVGSLNDFSISTWVNITTLNTWSRIFDFGTGTSYYMFLTPRASSATGPVRFAFKNGGSEQQINGTSALPIGKWVHVAITYDWNETSLKGVGKLYIDGNLVGTNTAMTINPSMLPATTQNYIAKSQYPDPALNGSIDEFRVYNRALGATDVLTLSGVPATLIAEFDNLQATTLKSDGDLSNVTSNLNIPASTSNPDVSISWVSALPTTLATSGTVVQPDKYDATVKLTATFTQIVGDKTYTLKKEFLITVKAKTEVSQLLAQWNFTLNSISESNGIFTVKDQSENGFTGTVMNNARIRTIGGSTSGIVNVLDLGNGTGYFDMGTEIGKAIYSLNNYTMSAYFRIDEANTDLNSNGNFIWNFSNSANAPVDMNGYIIGSLKNQSQNCTSSYWAVGDQGVGLNTNATKGSWHHIAFSQDGTTGTIFIDGVQVAQNTGMTNIPSTTLPKTGMTGTLFNWLGRSCYPADVYLKNTLLYDFQLYNIALTGTDLVSSLGVADSIAKLDAAFIENPDVILPELAAEQSILSLPDLSALVSDITLPVKGSVDNTVSISWLSSDTSMISSTGKVTRPSYFDKSTLLTATLSKNGQKLTKTFDATVLVAPGTQFNNDLLVKYDFVSVTSDSVVTDAAEKHFTGVAKNNSKIQTMGTTTQFKVLDLGENNGYFDMGTELGKVMYGLGDYTMTVFYRINEAYTGLSSNGNFIWNFSNSTNAMTDRNGYIIGSLKDQSQSITPGYYIASTGNQAVSFANPALQGGWHCMTYTQNGEFGSLFVDGANIGSATITNLPKNSLPKAGFSGTPFNWLGRSCYATDVYLKSTLIHDFRIYKKALTDEEILFTELSLSTKLAELDAAYAEGLNALSSVSGSDYRVLPIDKGIKITGLKGDEKISVFDVSGRSLDIQNPGLINTNSGIYIVKIDQYFSKVIVK